MTNLGYRFEGEILSAEEVVRFKARYMSYRIIGNLNDFTARDALAESFPPVFGTNGRRPIRQARIGEALPICQRVYEATSGPAQLEMGFS